MKTIYLFSALILLSFSSSSQLLTDSLLLHYPFDGNALDVSGNGFHGMLSGATLTTDPFGIEDSAYFFDGVDDFVDMPLVPELKPELPVSFACWIKLESLEPQFTVIATSDFAQNNHSGVWMNLSSTGKLAINVGQATGATSSNSRKTKVGESFLQTGTWYHIVGVVESIDDMELYINCLNDGGTYNGGGDYVGYTDAQGTVGRKDNDCCSPYHFFGSMDDFRYWNIAITEEEVLSLCPLVNMCDLDSTPPTFIDPPIDLELNCSELLPEAIVPLVMDDLSEFFVEFSEDIDSSDCYQSVVRTWTAIDACENASTHTQIIEFIDDESPIFDSLPENQQIECGADIPIPEILSATDNCDDSLEVLVEQVINIDSTNSVCAILNPQESTFADNWSMILSWGTEATQFELFQLLGGQIEEDEEGLTIYGQFESIENPGTGWDAVIILDNGLSWMEWSSQGFPTSYKAGQIDIGDNYLDWTFFLLSGESLLTGWGDYSNSYLSLSHFPYNSYYAFQYGLGTNNVNLASGIGGWFAFDGLFEGEEISGTGDFAFDLSCCFETEVQNIWTAVDCSGNSSTYTQTMSMNPSNFAVSSQCVGDFNSDYARSILDLLILLQEFGCENSCEGDMDSNGKTNVLDLLLFCPKIGIPCY